MNRKSTRNYQMLTRVADFATNNTDLFSKTTAAPEIVSALTAAVATLSEKAGAKVSAEAAIRTNYRLRIAARETLRSHLDQAVQTGRALGSDKFQMPEKRTDQSLINSGRAFVSDAEPLKEEFIRHGLPPEDVAAAVANLERALLNHSNAQAMRRSAIDEYGRTMDEAMKLLQRLEALVTNTLNDNPTAMASWTVARTVNRQTGRKAVSQKPAEPEKAVNPVAA